MFLVGISEGVNHWRDCENSKKRWFRDRISTTHWPFRDLEWILVKAVMLRIIGEFSPTVRLAMICVQFQRVKDYKGPASACQAAPKIHRDVSLTKETSQSFPKTPTRELGRNRNALGCSQGLHQVPHGFDDNLQPARRRNWNIELIQILLKYKILVMVKNQSLIFGIMVHHHLIVLVLIVGT